jgi:dihydroneopterin aldolase
VSAVDPDLFPAAVAAGATMVEIGNFDSFYPQGIVFGAAEVLELTRRTRALLPEVVLSVTVPHVLPLDEQEHLAVDLAAAGASDQLEHSLDYSRAITALQRLAGDLRCLTLEHFAERIFETLEQLYGPVPMALELRKCQAPVPGFSGIVAVQRSRHGG